MDRVFESGAAGAAPAAPATPSSGFPTGGNPAGGVPATKPGPYWFYMVTEEVRKVITDAGLTPDHLNLGQLSQAISLLTQAVPSGAVGLFAGSSAPSGWLKANGAAVSRTTYAALFAAIGTTFGAGNGTTTFNLPDLRGEFLRGWDDGRGIDSGRAFGSAQKGSLTAYDTAGGATPDATTSVSVLSSPTLAASQGVVGVDAYNTSDYAGATLSAATFASVTALPGGGGGVLGSGVVRPRNVALLACIKF